MLTPQQVEEYRKKYGISTPEQGSASSSIIKPTSTINTPVGSSVTPINELERNITKPVTSIEELDAAAGITKKPTIPTKKSFIEKVGGKDSIGGKIGNFLGEAIEQPINTVAGLGVTAYNTAGALKNVIQGKGYDTTKKRTLPILGETKPFITGKENFEEGVGKMFGGALDITSLLPSGKAASLAGKIVPGVKLAAKEVVKNVAPLVEKTAIKYTAEKAKKALQMTADELAKINPKRLEYLSKDSLAENAKVVGGILKKKQYDVSEKIKPLIDEFGHLLKSSNPTNNIGNVKKFMKDSYKTTLNLFEGNNPLINKKTAVTKLNNALKNDVNNVYGVDLPEVSSKTINRFLTHLKEGTAKGWEQARNAWYADVMKVSDNKLSAANKTLHDAIKNVIKSTLPKEKATVYDALKQSVAKANDVKEILKAKVKAGIGEESIAKKVGSFAKKAAIVGASALGIKSIAD